jgi:L-fuconolactonase
MALKLDSHQHFWKYSDAEYGWIDDAALRRDFLPDDLHKELRGAKLDGSVSVQARQTVGETEWLLSLAETHKFIRGVVGWVPLTSATVERDIEKFAANKKLKAVRHVVQDEKDDRYILREDFNAGVALLDKHGLAYDILIFDRHLPFAIEFVDRHPKQRFILDHIAKPRIREGVVLPWRENLRELSRRDNVWCKVSGVVTEAEHKHWTEAQLRFYIDTAMDAFGPKRIMFGSDWPVCLEATTYKGWSDLMHRATEQCSVSERAAIFGGSAMAAYHIEEKA